MNESISNGEWSKTFHNHTFRFFHIDTPLVITWPVFMGKLPYPLWVWSSLLTQIVSPSVGLTSVWVRRTKLLENAIISHVHERIFFSIFFQEFLKSTAIQL